MVFTSGLRIPSRMAGATRMMNCGGMRTLCAQNRCASLPSLSHASITAAWRPSAPLQSSLWRRAAAGGVVGLGFPVSHMCRTEPLLQPRRFQFSSTQDHYATLGVSPSASPDEIKAAYKKLALEFHPDRNSSPGAEDKFKTISAAYSVIGNKQKRKEYDGMRSAMGGGPRQSSDPSGRYQQNPFGGGGGGSAPFGYQQMSKEEADRLFRDIFGGVRVDQIFRNMEEEARRNTSSPRGFSFREFTPDNQAYRPIFNNESTRVFVDEYGNRMEERVIKTPRGTRFTVRSTSSTNPNASTNVTNEETYHNNATQNSDGRTHFGNSSFHYTPPEYSNDFGKAYFGVPTNGRHPVVALLLLVAWTTVIFTLVAGVCYFLFAHPMFTLALLFIVMARRARFF